MIEEQVRTILLKILERIENFDHGQKVLERFDIIHRLDRIERLLAELGKKF